MKKIIFALRATLRDTTIFTSKVSRYGCDSKRHENRFNAQKTGTVTRTDRMTPIENYHHHLCRKDTPCLSTE